MVLEKESECGMVEYTKRRGAPLDCFGVGAEDDRVHAFSPAGPGWLYCATPVLSFRYRISLSAVVHAPVIECQTITEN